MSEAYILDCKEEVSRLEEQSSNYLNMYDFNDEIKDLQINTFQNILDIGCGTGLTTRQLKLMSSYSNIIGIDLSKNLIDFCIQNENQNPLGIQYINDDFINIKNYNLDKSNLILIRYVMEHLKNPKQFLSIIKNQLELNGVIYIIDFDGLIYDFYTEEPHLNFYIEKLKQANLFDYQVGRKVPIWLEGLNFKNIEIKINSFYLQDTDKEKEVEMCLRRMDLAKEQILKHLSLNQFNHLKVLYKDHFKGISPLFINKYLIKATL